MTGASMRWIKACRARPVATAIRFVVGAGAAALLAWTAVPLAAADEETEFPFCLTPLGVDRGVQPTLRLARLLRVSLAPTGRPDTSSYTSSLSEYLPIPPDQGEAPIAKLNRLNQEGSAGVSAGRYPLAQKQLRECVQFAAKTDDSIAEATCANNLGVLHGALGQYGEAREMFERASARFDDWIRSDLLSSKAGNAALTSARDRNKYYEVVRQQATRDMDAALAYLGVETVALNLGNLAVGLGQLREAESHFRRGFDSPRPKMVPMCKAAAANDLARLYLRLDRAAEADALTRRFSKQGGKATTPGFEYGLVALGAVGQAAGPAVTEGTETRERLSPSARPEEQSEPKDSMAARGAIALQRLLEQAVREEASQQPFRAAAAYGQVVLRAAAAKRPEIELSARSALMRLYAGAGQPAVAVYHGKRAANLTQALRGGQSAAQMPLAVRRTYLRDRRQVYEQLAQLLIDQMRLSEAELVLRMLKEDEGQQFLKVADKAAVYAVLPESSQEKAARLQFEQAVQAVQQIDEERDAVAAKRGGILLKFDLTRIEHLRLDGGLLLLDFLEAQKKGASKVWEGELQRLPLEYQKALAGLFSGQAQQLVTLLRHLAEDAPRFRDTKATPQQLTRIDEALRRAKEIQVAFAPVLEQMRREPGKPMLAQLQMKAEEMPKAMMQPEALRDMSQTMATMASQMLPQVERLQQATGLAMQAYMTTAMGGVPEEGSLAAIDVALKGLPPQLLDQFTAFVKQHGDQMSGAQTQLAHAPSQLDALSRLAAKLSAVKKSSKGGVRPADDAVATSQPVSAPAMAADAESRARQVKALQAQLIRAAERAPRQQGEPAPLDAQLKQAFAAMPSQRARAAAEEREGRVQALASAEPLETLWRLDQRLGHIEADQQQAESNWAAQVARARPELPPALDETLSLLAKQSPATVLLYYMPGDDRLDILLVSAKGRKAWRVPVKRADLDEQVRQFQAALRNRRADPRPTARTMYDMLFAPVAKELVDSGAQVVALSLAGQLRFVPFAALHDGQQWVAERYALAVHAGASLSDAIKPPSEQWKVAAFGATAGGAGLPKLPSVYAEIMNGVVRQAGGGGALPGRAWLDKEFTAGALRAALAGDSRVVHIASHFKFEPGDAVASFLLLGDGTRLSLQDLSGPEYRFDRTELVTLSACQTALSEDDSFGQEVDGLGALLMSQGAPSVLASLWQVADDSTATLMGALYRAHELREPGKPPTSRAQALQQAQLTMIRDLAPPSSAVVMTGAESGITFQRGVSRPQDKQASAGAALGRTHPYHWAAFVLMGSWR